jgi:hypothetical protein
LYLTGHSFEYGDLVLRSAFLASYFWVEAGTTANGAAYARDHGLGEEMLSKGREANSRWEKHTGVAPYK